MRPARDAGSRDKLLFHLKTKGPQGSAELAKRLGLTPMAVRQHLAKLADEGLVHHRDEAGRVGRPRRIWSLAEAAEERFPDSHGELAVGLVEAARDAFGAEGLEALVASRTRAQLAAYRKRLPRSGASLGERVAALAGIRREEGYMAEWKRSGEGFRLIENHCPVCDAARACVGLCAGELELFRELLGPRVEIERTEHVLDGARRCVYAIRERRGS